MPTACPTPDELAAVLAGTLPDGSLETLDAHLAACGDCRGRLDALTESAALRDWLAGGRATAYPYLSAADRPGDLGRIGRYAVEAEIGRGGMGVVFRGRDAALGRPVALKVLRVGRDDEVAVERFAREGRAAAAVRHDHLVPVLDVTRTEDGRPCLVMPLVAGPTLRDEIRARAALPPRDAARLVRDVADGLAAVHRAGLTHRDVKPGNVLLDRDDGRAKLTDFGLARPTAAGDTLTETGTAAGTPEYLSPEQARDAARADARSDVYSLGVTLYECLTGVVPFRGPAFEVARRHQTDDPVPIRRLTRVPADLETVALKCLAKRPDRRYQSAADLRDDLDRWLTGVPVRARPVGRLARAARWCRRNPWPVGLLVVAAAGAAVSAVGWWRATANANLAAARAADAARQAELADERALLALDTITTLVKKTGNVIGDPPAVLALKSDLIQAALADLRRLTAALRDVPGAENAAAQAHQKLGDALHLLGQPDDAIAEWERVIAVAEPRREAHPADRVTARELAKAYVSYGDVKNRRGDYPGAADLFDRAIGVLTPVHGQFPDDVQIEDSLGFSWGHRGEVWVNAGKPREAIDCFRRGLAHVSRAEARAPGNAFVRSNRSALAARVGFVSLAGLHDYAAAEAIYREQLRLAADRLAADPADRIGQRDERLLRLELATALQRQGRAAEAEAEATRSLAPLAAAAAAAPDHALPQRDHAVARLAVGQAELAAGRYADAERSFAECLAIVRRVMAMRASSALVTGEYVPACQGLLNAAVRAGHYGVADDALRATDEFVRQHLAARLPAAEVAAIAARIRDMRAAVAAFPAALTDPAAGKDLPDLAAANAVWLRTFHLADRGDIAGAEAGLRDHPPRDPEHYFAHLARACIDAKAADREPDPARRQARIASGCQSLLRAIGREPSMLSVLHLSPELNPIRSSPEFRAYLGGLHPPAR